MKLNVIQSESAGPWYAEGLKFTCTQCGNCCTGAPGYVWIGMEEVGRLAEYLKLSPQEIVRKYCRRINGRLSLNEHRNARGEYDCTFLKEQPGAHGGAPTRTCTVYPVRPLQCRTWPFWPGLLKSPQSWSTAAERCPGMNSGKHYSLKAIESLRDAEDWPK